MDRDRDGHIAVSSTVCEMTVESAIRYDELGAFPLEGVPGEWRIYEVV